MNKLKATVVKKYVFYSVGYKYLGLLIASLALSTYDSFYIQFVFGCLASFTIIALIGKKIFNLNPEQILPIALALGFVIFHQSVAQAAFLDSTEQLVNTALASTGGAVDASFVTSAFAIIRTIVVIMLAGIIIVGIVRALRQDDYMFCVQAVLAIFIAIIGIESIANLVVT